MRAAIYERVSTTDQNCELQLRELQAYAERQGWPVVETYQDIMSSAKVNRPDPNRLMADARARKVDCLLVWTLDRFGRSLVDCLNNIRTLEENGVRFIAVTQGLDADQQNPAIPVPLHVLGARAAPGGQLAGLLTAQRIGTTTFARCSPVTNARAVSLVLVYTQPVASPLPTAPTEAARGCSTPEGPSRASTTEKPCLRSIFETARRCSGTQMEAPDTKGALVSGTLRLPWFLEH